MLACICTVAAASVWCLTCKPYHDVNHLANFSRADSPGFLPDHAPDSCLVLLQKTGRIGHLFYCQETSCLVPTSMMLLMMVIGFIVLMSIVYGVEKSTFLL